MYYFKLNENQLKKLREAHKNDTNATFQIASNKIFKGENIYYLDKIQLDKLKNAKEKKSGVRLEIRSSQIKDKKGGFLPLIFAGIGAASALVGGVTSIVNTVNDYKHKKAMEKETIRHNKEMENKEVELKAQDNPEIVVITNEESVCQSKNASKNAQSGVEQKVQSNHGNIEIVNELNEQVNQINKNESMEIQGLNLLHDYPTDQAHFLGITLTSVIKRSIIEYGPCRPKIEFPRNEDKRKFSVEYYYLSSKSGNRIPRTWLCYSPILNYVYCESCWLFADRQYINYKSEWITGIDNWQHLSQKIFKHESSIQHIKSVQIRSLWAKNKVLDSQLENQVSEEAAFWRSVLERIIMIILHLTSGNTALRGNEGKFSSKNQFSAGNFLQTVRLVANYDPILSKLINCEKSKIKYLSHTIVDELIGILSSDLLKTICNEIKLCQCFSIIMDSTLDITKLDQLSVIIRYTVIHFEEKKLEVKESFVGFFELKHHGAADYTQMIYEILSKLDLDINKCRGQGYDGASVMSGVHSGVQTRIKELVPSASYIHCCSHNLNLVISDAAKCHSKVLNFFDTVQAIFNFFASSAPRWALLAFGHDISIKIRTKVLKKVCPTRWEARHDAIFSLKERYIDVQ
ncbi:hypothetical protein QTP88_004518 [Uroleucon formosanum]